MSDAHHNTDHGGLARSAQAAAKCSARTLAAAKRDCPASERLPPELLGATFVYLPLGDRITASHVSQYWRAAALDTPQLWATVYMICSTSRNVALATMLLSRSGSIADVSIVSHYPILYLDFAAAIRADRDGDSNTGPTQSVENEENFDFVTIILPYLQKIRAFKWYSRDPVRSLCHPAPFLEQLHIGPDLDIEADFLAGGSGTLRTLRCELTRLPVVCPALSSVTDLRIDDVQLDLAAAVPKVFDLCPRLESLNLGGLRNEQSRQLLSGPPPASLRALTLKSTDPEWDMMQHFVALHTPDLRTFAMDIAASGRTILGPIAAQFLHGASGLHIREPYPADGSWLVVALPGAREHVLALPGRCVPDLALELMAARLRSVRTLAITIDLLDHFVSVAHALPALETVAVHLETFDLSPEEGPPRHPDTEIVGWDTLVYLQAVLDAAPQLKLLVLDTHCSWNAPGAEISVYDAETILSHLEFLGERTAPVPEIVVLGFRAETVRELDLGGLPVRFDTTEVGEIQPSYWPFKVQYQDN